MSAKPPPFLGPQLEGDSEELARFLEFWGTAGYHASLAAWGPDHQRRQAWHIWQACAAMRAAPAPLVAPMQGVGGYELVYLDFPWDYTSAGAIRTFRGTRSARADAHYSTMTLEEGIAMRPEVEQFAGEDCWFVSWGTWPKLLEYVRLHEAWGLEFVTCLFVWVKTTQDHDAEQSLLPAPEIRDVALDAVARSLMGFYTKGNTEYCALWRCGDPPRRAVKDVKQVIHAPLRAHSQKPDEAWRRIDRLWPTLRKLEMFARPPEGGWPGRLENWHFWGDAVEEIKLREPWCGECCPTSKSICDACSGGLCDCATAGVHRSPCPNGCQLVRRAM